MRKKAVTRPPGNNHQREQGSGTCLLIRELGREEIKTLPRLLDHPGKSRKGTSTLNKWTCPECGLNARFGIKGNPEIVHEPCSQKKGEKVFFVQADSLTYTIFQAKNDPTQTSN